MGDTLNAHSNFNWSLPIFYQPITQPVLRIKLQYSGVITQTKKKTKIMGERKHDEWHKRQPSPSSVGMK